MVLFFSRLNDSGQSSTRRIMRLRFLLWRFVMSPRCFISRFLFLVQLWYLVTGLHFVCCVRFILQRRCRRFTENTLRFTVNGQSYHQFCYLALSMEVVPHPISENVFRWMLQRISCKTCCCRYCSVLCVVSVFVIRQRGREQTSEVKDIREQMA